MVDATTTLQQAKLTMLKKAAKRSGEFVVRSKKTGRSARFHALLEGTFVILTHLSRSESSDATQPD